VPDTTSKCLGNQLDSAFAQTFLLDDLGKQIATSHELHDEIDFVRRRQSRQHLDNTHVAYGRFVARQSLDPQPPSHVLVQGDADQKS
jgi:hypothetical protein